MAHTLRRTAAALLSASMAFAFAIAVPLAPAAAQDKTADSPKTNAKDRLTLKNGSTVEGQILDESATTVRMKVIVAGIAAETTYNRDDILAVERGIGTVDEPKAANDTSKIKASKSDKAADAGDKSGAVKVYVIELTGGFGEEITQTPIRQAMHDARKQGADYVIVRLDNDWSQNQGGLKEEKADDESAFDELFRAEDMDPIFTEEVEREWTKQPKIVFWVNKAMGGAAFLPLNCKNIYFSSEAKMGGIGHLNQKFGGTGDKVVREKQYSLRLAHARGMANTGGYDGRLIEAMARDEYVLSYRMVGGKAELFEGYPSAPGEVLLTDDGQGESKDTIDKLARSEGNDCLTLDADTAFKLGVSKGTVDRLEDLIVSLGIARNHTITKTGTDFSSNKFMKGWRDGLSSANTQLPKLWRKYGEVEVAAPGEYEQRSQARSKRISILTDMRSLLKRFEESINPRALGVPGIADIDILIQQIKLQQLADQRERRQGGGGGGGNPGRRGGGGGGGGGG
ncbi:MAG: hypothetical protein ACKVW3_17260 [Phycisphaerales bacterium]